MIVASIEQERLWSSCKSIEPCLQRGLQNAHICCQGFFSVLFYPKTAVLNGFVQYLKEVCAVLKMIYAIILYPLKDVKVSEFGIGK